MPETAARPMPGPDDVAEIRTIAEAYTGDQWIYQVIATSAGVLVRYHFDFRSPAPALEAVGYRTETLRHGLVLVTGAVDRLALLEAQIAALQAERDRLAAGA